MTEINFHHGCADPLLYACRLLARARQRGARVAVAGAGDRLGRLDQALWTFEPLAFLPHARLPAGQAVPARLAPTPIWLLDDPADAPHHEVMVNLGPEVPSGFESFERLFEVVGDSGDEREAGRRRWRHYESRGYPIVPHRVQNA